MSNLFVLLGLAATFVATFLIGNMHTQSNVVLALEEQNSSSNQTKIVIAQTQQEKTNLERFNRLDFDAWNTRNWTLFKEIHAPDVLVVDFSGNVTRGIDQHLQWAKATMSNALIISAHPIMVAAGDWTAVTGTLPGNHTMITLAHWKDGRIAEEYLWSN
jgi:SnoaL-like domain